MKINHWFIAFQTPVCKGQNANGHSMFQCSADLSIQEVFEHAVRLAQEVAGQDDVVLTAFNIIGTEEKEG